jgi:dihydrodipicolinate synthase/N-acetylneuraminate lyase
MKTARDMQRRLAVLAQKISIPYGIAGVKAALDLCGYAGGPPRAPLVPLEVAGRRAVAAALREARAGLEY